MFMLVDSLYSVCALLAKGRKALRQGSCLDHPTQVLQKEIHSPAALN